MATTERRLEEVRELETIWELPSDVSRQGPPQRRAFDPARVLPGAWIVAMASILLLQPAPSHPDAAVPAWAWLLVTSFWAGLFAAMYGLVGKKSWALHASAVTAGLGMVVAVACLATDHHTGAWWGFEMAAFTALGGLSLAALRRRSA
jgi:hypothetical protein